MGGGFSKCSRYREFEHEVKRKVISPDSRQGQWESTGYIQYIYIKKLWC